MSHQTVQVVDRALDGLLAQCHHAESSRRRQELQPIFKGTLGGCSCGSRSSMLPTLSIAYVASEVWLWDEWPDRFGADTGIDLVAKTL